MFCPERCLQPCSMYVHVWFVYVICVVWMMLVCVYEFILKCEVNVNENLCTLIITKASDVDDVLCCVIHPTPSLYTTLDVICNVYKNIQWQHIYAKTIAHILTDDFISKLTLINIKACAVRCKMKIICKLRFRRAEVENIRKSERILGFRKNSCRRTLQDINV